MIDIRVSAPGKLMLIGEYAVLDGAPALILAADRCVRLRLTTAFGNGCLSAPQLGIHQAEMRIDSGRLCCKGVRPERLGLTGRLIPAILRALGRAPGDIKGLNIEIDSGALFENDAGREVKLGLGSSAAVCAALATGLGVCFGESRPTDEPGKQLRCWLPVYREALGARASGADLAAAFHGGFMAFRVDDNHVDDNKVRCKPLVWPETLHWRAIWTRQAAQTTDFVAAFDAWKARERHPAGGMRARLDRIAGEAVESAANGPLLADACAAYADALMDLGDAMGMEIMTAPHRRLAEFGRECGVVYKSCGAGGGDIGIALASDSQRLETFAAGVSDQGGVPLNLAISETGTRLAGLQVRGMNQ